MLNSSVTSVTKYLSSEVVIGVVFLAIYLWCRRRMTPGSHPKRHTVSGSKAPPVFDNRIGIREGKHQARPPNERDRLMSNLYPTAQQWTRLAEAAYPVALRRDLDQHDPVSNRIEMLVRAVLGITRGSILKATAKAVSSGGLPQTMTYTLADMEALASYAVKPGMSTEKRLSSFQSGRTGWHGPIGAMVIPAMLRVNEKGKPAPWLIVDGLSVVPNPSGNVHLPLILKAEGGFTVALSAFGNVADPLRDSTVAVTTYLRPTTA